MESIIRTKRFHNTSGSSIGLENECPSFLNEASTLIAVVRVTLLEVKSNAHTHVLNFRTFVSEFFAWIEDPFLFLYLGDLVYCS